ncbi:MAG: hypothetical protein PHO33_04605, partial [Clostridia bacterium]|nr:hypothetical protein [Clostridia bacterium]
LEPELVFHLAFHRTITVFHPKALFYKDFKGVKTPSEATLFLLIKIDYYSPLIFLTFNLIQILYPPFHNHYLIVALPMVILREKLLIIFAFSFGQ